MLIVRWDRTAPIDVKFVSSMWSTLVTVWTREKKRGGGEGGGLSLLFFKRVRLKRYMLGQWSFVSCAKIASLCVVEIVLSSARCALRSVHVRVVAREGCMRQCRCRVRKKEVK